MESKARVDISKKNRNLKKNCDAKARIKATIEENINEKILSVIVVGKAMRSSPNTYFSAKN